MFLKKINMFLEDPLCRKASPRPDATVWNRISHIFLCGIVFVRILWFWDSLARACIGVASISPWGSLSCIVSHARHACVAAWWAAFCIESRCVPLTSVDRSLRVTKAVSRSVVYSRYDWGYCSEYWSLNSLTLDSVDFWLLQLLIFTLQWDCFDSWSATNTGGCL